MEKRKSDSFSHRTKCIFNNARINLTEVRANKLINESDVYFVCEGLIKKYDKYQTEDQDIRVQ